MPKFATLDRFEFASCLGNFRDIAVNYYLDLYGKYQRGLLPFKGTICEQPNKIIEIFDLIDEIGAEKAKEDKRRGK